MEVIKTFVLMGILMAVFMIAGYLLGGSQGLVIAFFIALATNFFSYFFSDKMVLNHYRAVLVTRENAEKLYNILDELAYVAQIPTPKLYIIDDKTPNAFATGRNYKHSAIAINTGLLDILNEDEVKGVLAHELSHVRHYDILIGSIATTFAGAIAIIANFAKIGTVTGQNRNRNNVLVLIAAMVMPFVATIITRSISRNREFLADAGAANLTNNPMALASALSKLESYARGEVINNATLQSSHMFIINPFTSVQSKLTSLFRTHPSTQDRIRNLKAIDEEFRRRR